MKCEGEIRSRFIPAKEVNTVTVSSSQVRLGVRRRNALARFTIISVAEAAGES